MSEVDSSPAVIVSRIPYQENDLILGLLTRNEGPISVLARGARNSRKRFAGVLDLFVVFDAAWKAGRGSLPVLSRADPLEFFPGIHESLDRLEQGQAMLQSIRGMIRDAPVSASIFDGVRRAFGYLEFSAPGVTEMIHLEMVLMIGAELGHVPSGGICPGCGLRSDDFVVTESGMVLCARKCVRRHPGTRDRALGEFPLIYVERRPLQDDPGRIPEGLRPDGAACLQIIAALVGGVSGYAPTAGTDRRQS